MHCARKCLVAGALRLAAALSRGMALVADPQQLPAVVIALPAEIDMANATGPTSNWGQPSLLASGRSSPT
jgi:hypothetical protein